MSGLAQLIKDKARRLGFILAGFTSPEPPAHYDLFQTWLKDGNHAGMFYLGNALDKRADPKLILPECKSILILALPYSNSEFKIQHSELQVAAYALGQDYHETIPPKLQALVSFIEEQVGRPVPNRCCADTAPILERELAQRAGLGWIGKNSMLIHPRFGSAFLLAEIFLGVEIEPDNAFAADHCGTCVRCAGACPTHCILPNRTIDSRRCISYLTIENKGSIPVDLRPQIGNWVFGCDICQAVCPWNRFSPPGGASREAKNAALSAEDLTLSPVEFNRRFKRSPLWRAKRRGLLRNLAVALGNTGRQALNPDPLSILQQAAMDEEPLIREHAQWALKKLQRD